MLLRHFSSHRDRKAGDVGELLHRALWSFLWISLQFPCRCSGPAGRVSVPRVSLRLLAQRILAYLSSHSWRQPQTEPQSLSLSLNVWALLVSVSLLLEKATCICLFVGLLLVFVSYLNPCSNSSLGQASLRIWSLLGLKGTATKAEIKSKPWDPAVWFLYVVSTHCQTDRLKHVDNLLICIDIMFLYTV